MPMVASFPLFDTTVSLTFPFCILKNSIGRITLNEDRLFFGKRCDLPPTVDGRKECLGIEFATFLGRYLGSH